MNIGNLTALLINLEMVHAAQQQEQLALKLIEGATQSSAEAATPVKEIPVSEVSANEDTPHIDIRI